MSSIFEMNLENLLNGIADLTLEDMSLEGRLPLEEYFPPDFQIHEYNATENRIIKSSTLNDDLKNWLRDKANYKFTFQCLLCCQEMSFNTAFCRGNYVFNRSHLLTVKHKNKEKAAVCVGVLFLSSQKFVLCKKTIFDSGNIFDETKKVKRRDESLVSSLLQNKVSCANYSMHIFDRQTKTLKEMEFNIDFTTFMREEVRPLFTFQCMICDARAASYTGVIKHLLTTKHIQKLGVNKGVIISIKDFNIFVACEFKKLTSLLFLNHLNSYLEEIVLASEGSIIISGCHTNDGKIVPSSDSGISVNINPIKFLNGETINQSIKIKTRYHNALAGPSDPDISAQLASGGTQQKNVTIYEFSTKNLEASYMDNILYATFCIGCRIWCSRCQIGLSTLQVLQSHLSSIKHTQKFRGNEQVGFMCHACNIFFIEMKGESFIHTHSSQENKKVIKRLNEERVNPIDFCTPLMKSITKSFVHLLSNVAEACKFCCVACSDIAKQKLMYLGYHEITDCHKNLSKTCLYTYCEYCNVVYIDKELSQNSMQFKLHYTSHLSEENAVIRYSIHDIKGSLTESAVDKSSVSLKNITLLELPEKPLSCQKLAVRYSKYFMQFMNPGICSKEYVSCENWDNYDFCKYLEVYTAISGSGVKLFECLICKTRVNSQSLIIDHLFISSHQKSPLNTNLIFIKICDVCDLAIISGNLVSLQRHFDSTDHLCILKGKTDLPSMFAMPTSLNEFMKFSKIELTNKVRSLVDEMRLTFNSRNRIFKMITDDVMALLSSAFPDVSVTFYGSRLSGLALPGSDFDICLNIGNQHLEEVCALFSTGNRYFELIVCIRESSVPLIRATHKSSGGVCDFNLENCEFKPHVSKLIKMFIDIDEVVIWVLAAVRYWAESTNLKSTNMFSSHAISWLVLFYLMQPDVRVIPNVLYVMEACGSLDNIRDGDFILDWRPQHKVNKEKTWLDLLEGFFNYYCNLKFSDYHLFSISGLVIPRKLSTITDGEKPMFMQDPLNSARNILFNATMEKLEKLKSVCYFSLHLPWRLD